MAGETHDQLTRLPQFQEFASHLEGIAVWAGDESGYDYMSPGFEDIWGMPVETVMDDIWRVLDGVHPEDRDRVVHALEGSDEVLDRGERFEIEHRVLRPDGEVRWVQTRIFPVHDEAGDPIETVGMAIDVTEQKEAELALERQNERLERFAETVSHDLRSPLGTAMGFLEVLEDAVDHPAVERVERALSRMESMIDQILMLARTGQEQVETEPVDLRAVVAAAWDDVGSEAATLAIRGELGTIAADEALLRRLFENLLRNAVEHGGSAVTVSVGRLEDRQGIYVADDGPGIPPERHAELFEAGPGSSGGLGLVIVREICELHDWAIDVVDRDGARFEISGIEPR